MWLKPGTQWLLYSVRFSLVAKSTLLQLDAQSCLSAAIRWVEIDPEVIVNSVVECIEKVAEYLADMGLSHKQIKAVGVSNQRETTILWDKTTGKALYNAVGKYLAT